MNSYARFSEITQRNGIPLRAEFVVNFFNVDNLLGKVQELFETFINALFENNIIHIFGPNEFALNKYNDLVAKLQGARDMYTKPPTKKILSKINYTENLLLHHLGGCNNRQFSLRAVDDYSLRSPEEPVIEYLELKDLNRAMIPYDSVAQFALEFYDYLPLDRWDSILQVDDIIEIVDEEETMKIYHLLKLFTMFSFNHFGVFVEKDDIPSPVSPIKHLNKTFLLAHQYRWQKSYPVSVAQVVNAILNPPNRCAEIIVNNFYDVQERRQPQLRDKIKRFVIKYKIDIFPSLLIFGKENIVHPYSWSEIWSQ